MAGMGLAAVVVAATALAATGELTPKGCIDDEPPNGPDDCAESAPALNRPVSVAVSPDGKSVYVTSMEQDDAVTHFRRNRKTGKLTPRGCVDDTITGGEDCDRQAEALDDPGSVAVSPDGRYVYTSSFGDDAILRLRRNLNTGELNAMGCVDDDDTSPTSCGTHADGLEGATSVAISPDGRSLYATSQSDRAIVRFKRNRENGALIPRGCIQDPGAPDDCAKTQQGLALAASAEVSPDGRSVYVVDSVFGDGALVRFKRDTGSGALKPKGCIVDEDYPTPGCVGEGNGWVNPSGVALSPDGRSLYVAGNGEFAIARFKRDTTSGKLTYRGCVDDDESAGTNGCAPGFGLEGVASVAVSSDGRSVYAAAADDDAVVQLRRKRKSGAIAFRGCVEDSDIPFLFTECGPDVPGLDLPTGVTTSPDGKSVYATSIDDDAIVTLKRER
jgi:DNA-binding beta-propeller fold protein YncE